LFAHARRNILFTRCDHVGQSAISQNSQSTKSNPRFLSQGGIVMPQERPNCGKEKVSGTIDV
jgi:hypothetical protein